MLVMTLFGELSFGRLEGVLKRVGILLLASLSLTSFNCQTGSVANLSENSSATERAAKYGYEVVNTWPHDPAAYTQGLVFQDGKLLESTGQEGKSSLRRVELDTGKVLQQVNIPSPYFAEGLTLLKGKLYQLTWQHQRGFIYDAWTFEKIGEFSYSGEGWGLTNDGESLILSDGTNRLRFLNPDNFQVKRSITVLEQRRAITDLNELEYVHGEIYANVWHTDRIARIDPQTGRVSAWVDLAGLKPAAATDEEAVLNGIAYDQASDRLFVTGKLWPKLFEIRLKRIP